MAKFEYGWLDVLKAEDLTAVVQWTKAGSAATNLNQAESEDSSIFASVKWHRVFSDFVGRLGEEGWELAWINDTRHYFKRQID
jgi:hypothetical protein